MISKVVEITVNWILPTDTTDYNKISASAWIRSLQLFPYLRRNGINCLVNGDQASDIIIIERSFSLDRIQFIKKNKSKGVKIIFDLCVNYLEELHDSQDQSYGVNQDLKDKTIQLISLSDAVFCSSEYIYSVVSKIHEHVFYLSDSIDMGHFKFSKTNYDLINENFTLLYSGVSVKTDWLFDNLYSYINKNKIKLIINSEKRPKYFKKYKYIRWKYENFPSDILSATVGISPRDVSSPYNKGHSLYKIGVFIAQKIPVLASPVPSYSELISDNQCGIICKNINEWTNSIDFLLNNRDALPEMMKNSEEIIKPYTTESISYKYINIFSEIVSMKIL